ncbi:uncharacterized protein LOC110720065 isoform X1 [Chenopodium quinoa]|uniref:uncharacterized protein LOC110720065 isoform X1 n=1 Tax=Chenopodium quinoa TaxID=63459 RepID=UPI000B778C1D|nr:uncharacterized protein LOC110720065 isoform X1 [Chenopodium quinoa]XP_021754763.1 uncharacterized protein LOC110720065 isoform X1 [Chenopodium quinoa]XP_021754766.1 uncharacterized protein LOC110720065 isoform X1 [Chenopodium quinoa]
MPKEKRMTYVLYDFISEDMWKTFVEEHSTDDFKEISEKARQSQSFNEYPHHLGAKSYGEMNIVWRRKGYIPTASSASSTSSCSSVVSSLPDRTYAWLLARSIEDDKGNPYLPDEKTREVKESIDNWRNQQAEGKFVPNRHDDILSLALGKKDRNGRAIAFGNGIGIKAAWGSGERRSGRRGREFGDDELEELEARVARRVREETMQEMDSKMDSMVQEKFMLFAKQIGIQIPTELMEMNNIGRTTQQNPSSFQSVGDDPFANIQEPDPCRLSLLKNDSEKVIVAEGTYHPELILDHHSNLLPDHVRVSVDDFFDEFKEFLVPVPSSVIKKLKHAHGTFTQWPKDLVSLMHDKEFISNKNNGNNKAAKENMQDKLKVVESGHETKESNTNPKKVFLMDYALENLSQ